MIALLINPATPTAQAAQMLKNVWQINLAQAEAMKQQQQLDAIAKEEAIRRKGVQHGLPPHPP